MNKPYNGPSVIDDYQLALEKARQTIRDLEQEVKDLEYNQNHAYTHEDGSYSTLNDLRRFYKNHQDDAETIERLRKEIDALNYNMDHAHEDGDKFLTVDDLCIFYDEHKNSTPQDDGKFQAYTEGFWKGFDMGYEKAKKE